jgi:hypothetical protein
VGKEGGKDVIIHISDLLMKTMLGDFVVSTKSGEVLREVPSFKVDKPTLQLMADNEFKEEDFPLAISYRDSRKVPVFTFELKRETFTDLKNVAFKAEEE